MHVLRANPSQTVPLRLQYKHDFLYFVLFDSFTGWIILGTTMLMFSFIIAMFPRHLPQTNPSKVPNLSISENPIQLPHEEQPLTKAMLSDFMPNDPVSTKQKEILHTQETSAKNVEGTVRLFLALFGNSVSAVEIIYFQIRWEGVHEQYIGKHMKGNGCNLFKVMCHVFPSETE
jgi:hypothetical protein